jgi:hypothetical protein
MFGTSSPRGVAAAMARAVIWAVRRTPMVGAAWVDKEDGSAEIRVRSYVNLLMSAKSGDAFSRLTSSIVRVASTSVHTDTCGAV